MSDLLETAIAEVRRLPEPEQARAAELLLLLAAQSERDLSLTPEQIEGIKAAREQVREGEYADKQIEAFYKRIGLK